jgi:hypothetical protein
LLIALLGVLPSLVVYIGNPSPPRHFYVLTVGLACLVAATMKETWIERVRSATIFIFLLNLVLPWSLASLDPRGGPRANITYNVIERTDRNLTQIAKSRLYYQRLLAAAGGEPVVFFGEWVHVAQIAAIVADDPEVTVGWVRLSPGVRALSIRTATLNLSIVETNDASVVANAVHALRQTNRAFRFVSIVDPPNGPNELNVDIPSEIYWWSAEGRGDSFPGWKRRPDRAVTLQEHA